MDLRGSKMNWVEGYISEVLRSIPRTTRLNTTLETQAMLEDIREAMPLLGPNKPKTLSPSLNSKAQCTWLPRPSRLNTKALRSTVETHYILGPLHSLHKLYPCRVLYSRFITLYITYNVYD